jgi:excisionase family DNA binding protein
MASVSCPHEPDVAVSDVLPRPRVAPLDPAVVLADPDALLSPGTVARLFRVTPKTVGRWAARGVLVAQRTVGGHRRFRSADVRDLLDALDGGWGASQDRG